MLGKIGSRDFWDSRTVSNFKFSLQIWIIRVLNNEMRILDMNFFWIFKNILCFSHRRQITSKLDNFFYIRLVKLFKSLQHLSLKYWKLNLKNWQILLDALLHVSLSRSMCHHMSLKSLCRYWLIDFWSFFNILLPFMCTTSEGKIEIIKL